MNVDFICYPIGVLLRWLYNIVSVFDTEVLSAYAISIVLSTIIFKLILMPLTLKQTRSMKVMQDMQPKIKELQDKYGKDPQTLQRKQMELYKEANYNPMAGCLPMLLQFPILIAFFYVIQRPEFAFSDLGHYVTAVVNGSETLVWNWTADINRSFFWIKDLSLMSNHIFVAEDVSRYLISPDLVGMVNGLSMGGLNLPFIGSAVPILAAISGYSTYLTSKMTMASQPVMSEQQQSTQGMMNMMMPVMLFVFSLQFPSGLALYWVVSNLFQVVQQWVILNSSKKPKGELK